jgi:hypothetical protein
VNDAADQCAGTPAGTVVNNVGCPITQSGGGGSSGGGGGGSGLFLILVCGTVPLLRRIRPAARAFQGR